MAAMIGEYQSGYRMWPHNAAIFLPGGAVPRVGDHFLQTDLAGTLQAARAAFYCGDIAQRIAAYHEQEGGYLTRADLASLRSRYEPVVRTRWRDFEVLTCSPWCQGSIPRPRWRARWTGPASLPWAGPGRSCGAATCRQS